MKNKSFLLVFAAVVVIGAVAYGSYRFGMTRNSPMANEMASGTGNSDASTTQGADKVDLATGKKVLYWHDPMVPGQKFDKPGKSPFMDMQLVPVYAEGEGDGSGVSISPRVQQNLGVRTAEVTKGTLTQKLEAVGNIAYNERAVALVTARANGYIERLFVRAPLDPVRKGQPLADVFSPDWVAAQEEYLSVRRMQGAGTEGLMAGARQRMLLAGMNEDQIRVVESSAKVQPRFTLTAPVDGVIAELGAREGMTVMAGAMLFRINGLGSVWINAEIPESAAGLIRPGNVVEARTPALPERVFKGRVAAILPEVNPATRTLKARVEVANTGGLLAPGMFANVDFTPSAKAEVLLVPSEAVIQTGTRKVVIVVQESGKFQSVDVETGAEANGQVAIRKGLEAGQKVVVSGQFLIDSEANLKATTTRMTEAPATKDAQPQSHHGVGKVEAVGKDAVTISHGPIPTLQWGAMTMDFKIPAAGLPKNVTKGGTVAFDFKQRNDGQYELTAIAPAAQMTPDAKGMAK